MILRTNPNLKLRSYSELITYKTFEERYSYLRLNGSVGVETFGYDRIFNQMFYTSKEWIDMRTTIIARDLGCDMGLIDFPINSSRQLFIHHMNPITVDDIFDRTDILLDPEYLITTFKRTHDAIHYGKGTYTPMLIVERTPHDTSPWRKGI